MTNSALQTTQNAKTAVERIIDQCERGDIHVNIVGGVTRPIQARLVNQTDGKWYPINNQEQTVHYNFKLDKSVLKIEGILKLIAQHIVATAQASRGIVATRDIVAAADIIFVFDSSLSMDTKVGEVCAGIDEMVNTFDVEGFDYRFGIIRFWAAPGGESVAVVTKPPLTAKQVKGLFRIPKQGDEHLLDAVIEKVSRLRTPDDRKLVLVIITDEATSRREKKGYTPEQAIRVCRKAGAQVNVIGGVAPIHSGSFSDAFQRRVAEVTGGKYYIMPGSTIADERR